MDPNGVVSPAVIAAMKQRIIEVRRSFYEDPGSLLAKHDHVFFLGTPALFCTDAKRLRAMYALQCFRNGARASVCNVLARIPDDLSTNYQDPLLCLWDSDTRRSF